MPRPKWCLYVLRCRDGSLYCGITNDLQRRIKQHNEGTGAKYTRGRRPVMLQHSWTVPGKSEALRAEIAFKKLSRPQKFRLLSRARPPLPAKRVSSGTIRA